MIKGDTTCTNPQLRLLDNPFADKTYYIGDQEIVYTFSIFDLIYPVHSQTTTTKDYVDPCGDIVVEFFNDDNLHSQLDSDIFKYGKDASDWQFFKVIQTMDYGKIGDYPIKYKVYY